MKNTLIPLLKKSAVPALGGASVIAGLIIAEQTMFNQVREKIDRKTENNFGNLRDFSENITPNNFRDKLERLYSVEDKYLTKEQQFSRLITEADTFLTLGQDYPHHINKNWAAAKARKSLVNARKFVENKSEQIRLNQHFAKCDIFNESYDDALNHIETTLELTPPEKAKYQLLLQKAAALKHKNNDAAALNIIDQLVKQDLSENLHRRALQLKGDILSSQIIDHSFLNISKLDQTSQKSSSLDDEMIKKAAEATAIYKKLINERKYSSEGRANAQLGLLKVAAARKQSSTAYDILNKMTKKINDQEIIRKAYSLVADMETALNQPDRVIYLLQMAIQRSEDREKCYSLYKRLLASQYQAGEYSSALKTLHEMAKYINEQNQAHKVLDYLLPDKQAQNKIISNIKNLSGSQKKVHTDMLFDIPDRVSQAAKTSWDEVNQKTILLRGYILYCLEDYCLADRDLSRYLGAKGGRDDHYIEQAMYCKVKIAQKCSDIPPIKTAARASQYLQRFPNGNHHRKMRHILKQTYQDMKYYGAATHVLKATFIENIISAAKESNSSAASPSIDWLKDLDNAAVCYMQNGDIKQAEQFFEMFMNLGGPEQASDSFLLDWVLAAYKNEQIREGNRRASIAIFHADRERTKQRIRMARLMRGIELERQRSNQKDSLKELMNITMEYRFEDYNVKQKVYSLILNTLYDMKDNSTAAKILKNLNTHKDASRHFIETWHLKWFKHFLNSEAANEKILEKMRAMLPQKYNEEDEPYTEYGQYLGEQMVALDTVLQTQDLIDKIKSEIKQ